MASRVICSSARRPRQLPHGEPHPFTPGLASACLILAILAIGCPAADEREAGFRRVATEQGVALLSALPSSAEAEVRALPGPSMRDRNFFPRVLATGDWLVFDWVSRDGAVKERDREAQTVFAFRRGDGEWPRFVWQERGALPREDERRLGGIVAFEGVLAFSDRHAVVGPDAAAIRVVFDRERRAQLVLPDGLRVEAAGPWLAAFRPGELVEPTQIARTRAAVEGVLAPLLDAGR